MKIGFVLDDSLDKSDGVQQYVLTVGHWLHQQGHEVHYLVGQTERSDITHVHSLSRNIQVHFNQNRMSTPLPASKVGIRQLLDEHIFDVLHVQMPYSPFLASKVIASAAATTAVIGTFHIVPFSTTERLATKLLRVSLRRSLKRFDKIISVSKPAQQFAKSSMGVESVVIPNPVHLAQYRSAKHLKRYDDKKINIVFLGRLVDRKGCMYLLQAIQALHAENLLGNVRVIICGKGPLLDSLKSFVHKHHLGKIVQFVGFINEQDKPDYLASADLAVFPSTGGESFGIVLVEAMAVESGVVLAGNNLGYSTVITRTEQLINPKDTVAFAKTIKHFLFSAKARKQAKTWQNLQVKQFDVNVVGEKLLNIYLQEVAKRSKYSHN